MKFAVAILLAVLVASVYAEDASSSEEFQCEPAIAAGIEKCGDNPAAEQKCVNCLQKKCYNLYEDRNCNELTQCIKDSGCKKKN